MDLNCWHKIRVGHSGDCSQACLLVLVEPACRRLTEVSIPAVCSSREVAGCLMRYSSVIFRLPCLGVERSVSYHFKKTSWYGVQREQGLLVAALQLLGRGYSASSVGPEEAGSAVWLWERQPWSVECFVSFEVVYQYSDLEAACGSNLVHVLWLAALLKSDNLQCQRYSSRR